MAHFKGKVTPLLVIAFVLIIGLLSAASAGLFARADEQGGQPSVAAPSGDNGEGAINPDMPKTLPMPEPAKGEESVLPTADGRNGPQNGAVNSGRRSVTRAELAAFVAERFAVNEDDIFDATKDGRSDEIVTRADVAIALVRALDIEHLAKEHGPTEPIFRDVAVDHKAFSAIALLDRLGMYPFHIGTLFAPDERVERAEILFTLDLARKLEAAEGPIVHINPPARTLSVQWEERHAIAYTVGEDTLIVRNDVVVPLEKLQPGDDIRLLADETGAVLLAFATGDESSPTVTSEAVALLKELATPEQLAAIIARDWDKAALELRSSVYNQLLERGVTAEEATALLNQDWTTIEEKAKGRLTELITGGTDLNEELVRAVLNRDWDTALSHLEVEVLEYLLNYLMV